MSILNSVIKLFVGDKQQKDLKSYNLFDDVKNFEAAIRKLSNDELRAKTLEFKKHYKRLSKKLMNKITS